MSPHFATSALYQLKRGCGYPPPDVIARLKTFGLFRNRSQRRGTCAQRIIPVIAANKSETGKKPAPSKPYKHFEVPRVWYDLPSLFMSNVTSLCNKFDEVVTTVKTVSADVVAITEAWQIVPETCKIDNFHMFHQLRTDRRGGGVVFFCRKELNPSNLHVDVPEGVEALWVKVNPPSHPRHTAAIIYCVIYHPPRSPTGHTLIEHLINTSDTLRARFPAAKLVLCGDFNELDTSEIQDQLNLSQIVDFPTHEGHTLDLIISDLSEQYLPPQPLPPVGRSKHLSIFWSPAPTTTQQRGTTTRTYRPLTDSAVRQFGQWVVRYPWTEVLTVDDVCTKWDNYVSTTTQAYHHFFPTKRMTMHSSDVPWITPRVKRLMQQRNRAFYIDSSLYRTLRNKVIREIRSAKKSFYPTKIHHLKQASISQWFTKVKDLCGIKKQSSSLSCIADLTCEEAAARINDHFSSICQTLPSLNPTHLPAYLPAPSPPPTVEEYEVCNKLLSFKATRSTTPVDLPVKIYQEFAVELATPLCSIINASISQSKCPSDWKTSFVTPIPKTPSPQSLNDLRPIAITPLPSLLCEDFIFNWAYSNIANVIDPQQFGNMKTSSTTHCLVSFLDFIYKNLEKRKTSVALAFIDFRKAFDLVDHTIIINKAIKMGLHPNLVSWLANFISERRQAVRYQGCVSPHQHLTCGVPQGTKMGPLCFLLLINDALTETPFRWKYVDDSTVGVTVNNGSPDYTPLQDILDRLQAWTAKNNVTINGNKTVVMHISTSTTQVPPPAVRIGAHHLQVVESTKLLGVTVDCKLNWKQHVNNTVKSASYKLYMLRRLKSLGMPQRELKSIFTIFILPKLAYASPAWSSSLSLTQQRQLERVQKRACRVILGDSYTTYEEALTTLELTTLSERHLHILRQFGTRLLTHPRHRQLLPEENPRPRHAVRHHNKIKPIRAVTDRYKKSAVPTIVKLINYS